MIRVLILSDIRLYRDGLAQILCDVPEITVADTVASRSEVAESLSTCPPDIVLLDMTIPESVDTVREIRAAFPDTRIVALAVFESEHEVMFCAEAGVSGYVPREAGIDDLIACLESVMRGETLCSPRVAAALIGRVAELAMHNGSARTAGNLTPRERQIVRLIDRGFSNKRIARELHITVATVKNHVHNILEKLGVSRRGEAARRLRMDESVRRLGREVRGTVR